MTSCTWDYVTSTPANKSYTLMLCCFVFFIPLAIISFCYLCMFLAIRRASRDIQRLGVQVRKSTLMQQQTIRTEWKLAKIASVVIIVFVLSWSPYGGILSPYSKAVPAVIAKASAIYNPLIYAIIHSKYRDTLAEHVPCLHFLRQAPKKDCLSVSNSECSFRDSVFSRQSSVSKNTKFHRVWSDVELEPVDLQHHHGPSLRTSLSLGVLGRTRESRGTLDQNQTRTNRQTRSSASLEQAAFTECRPSVNTERCGHNFLPQPPDQPVKMAAAAAAATTNTAAATPLHDTSTGGSVTPEHCNALPNNNDNDQEVEEEEEEEVEEEEEEEEAACEDSPEGSQRQQNRQQHHIGDRSDSSSSSSSSHEQPRPIETSPEPAVDNAGLSPQSDRREIPAAARSPAAGCRAREEEGGVYGGKAGEHARQGRVLLDLKKKNNNNFKRLE
ncbi:hypothetical protein CRUP_031440, partial [Coryphaenoides rupestris]